MSKVTLSSFAERTVNGSVRRYVRNLISQIDSAILLAHSEQRPQLKYPLPTVFDFPGFARKDLQIYAYSELLELYNGLEQQGGRGFHAVVEYGNDSATIVISWPPPLLMDASERERRADILSRYRQPTQATSQKT
jgi:hypothetical protein